MNEVETLPDTWIQATLDEVTQISPEVDLSGLDGDALVHFVPMASVAKDFSGIDVSSRRPLSEVRKGYSGFVAGDVLLAKITPCMENGKGGLVPPLPQRVAFGSTEFHVMRATDAVSSSWVAWFLAQPVFRKVARANMTGTAGQMRVPTKWLRTVKLPVPPRGEQTRIVEKLEELLSDLDAGVAELKAAQKKLAQYRQSLLKAAVEGALTAEWRQQHPPGETGAQLLQRILTERRARWEAKQLAKFKEQGKAPPKDWQKKYPEPVQPDTSGLPELPQGWVWASVEQLGVVQLGRQRSPDKVKGISPVAYIRAANITEAGIDLTDVLEMDFSAAEVETFALRPGDVLLTEASGSAEHVGRPAIWRGASKLHCFQNTVLRFRSEHIDAEFSYLAFLAMQKMGVFRKLSGGVGINHLSAGKFSGLPMALPPSDEQAELVRQVMALLNGCDQQLNLIERSLKQSTAQRQNILRAAFAGQLVPQDPADEPASVLLERIRAERMATDAQKKPRNPKKEPA